MLTFLVMYQHAGHVIHMYISIPSLFSLWTIAAMQSFLHVHHFSTHGIRALLFPLSTSARVC